MRDYYGCFIDAGNLLNSSFEAELQKVEENYNKVPGTFAGRPLLNPKRCIHFTIDRKYTSSNVMLSNVVLVNLKTIAEQLLQRGIQVDISVYERNSRSRFYEHDAKYFYKPEDLRNIQELNDYLVDRGMQKPIDFVGWGGKEHFSKDNS